MNSNLQVGYRAIWFSRMRICFIFVLAFGATPCVHARQPQIDELTNNVVEELIKTHEKAVVVFDFVGPDKKSTALGQKIADDFRNALTKSTAAFNVIDPAQITQALETNRVSPQILREPELELWLGKKLGTGIAILGELERDGENLNILVDTYQADGRPIDEFKIIVPLTDQMKSLLHTQANNTTDQTAVIPAVGGNGNSFPACVYCPSAKPSSQAAKSHLQGSVLLQIVVGPDGQAYDIRVVKMQPNGLTEMAIEAVQTWKFKPALGPDGKPAAVRRMVEMNFHQNK